MKHRIDIERPQAGWVFSSGHNCGSHKSKPCNPPHHQQEQCGKEKGSRPTHHCCVHAGPPPPPSCCSAPKQKNRKNEWNKSRRGNTIEEDLENLDEIVSWDSQDDWEPKDFSYLDDDMQVGRQYSCVVDTTGEVGTEGCVNAPISSNYAIDFKVFLFNEAPTSLNTYIKVLIVGDDTPILCKKITIPKGNSTIYVDGTVHLEKGDKLWLETKSPQVHVLKIRGGISTTTREINP